VLQLIYEFDRPSFPVYVGQQVDVFIERTSNAPVSPTNKTNTTPLATFQPSTLWPSALGPRFPRVPNLFP